MCCLDLIVALPCLESSWKTRGKKTGVSGFMGSRLSKTRLMIVKIKKKLTGSHPGLAGWIGFRVDRVFPGQFPREFLPQSGPVPGSGRPGTGSTRRACPGFKTLPVSFT